MTPYIRIAYLDGFNSQDALLIEGNAEGLDALAQAMQPLVHGELALLVVHALPFVSTDCKVWARHSGDDIGVSREGRVFQWARTREGWTDVVAKIRALRESGRGHHYLDGPRDEIEIVVSCGEGYEALFERKENGVPSG